MKKLFEEHGFNVMNANVISDPIKKPSGVPAYGYVTFAEDSELERCLKVMNNIKVQSQSIILNRQGDNSRNPLANIIIQGIPKNISQSEVHQAFKKYGDIKSCKLQTYHDNTSKGFAFVQYDRPEQAQAAISELNERQAFGATLKIEIFKKQNERIDPSVAQPQKPFTNLYVHGLLETTTVEQVKAIFAPIGEVESCSLKANGKGIAFVCYKKPEDALRAVEELNLKQVQQPGKAIFVSKLISRHENSENHHAGISQIGNSMKHNFQNNVFVNFLDPATTEEALIAKFSQTGEIVNVRLIRKPNRNFISATVLYKDFDGAQKAIQRFHDSRELCGNRPLLVDVWMPQEEMKHEQQQKTHQEFERLLNSLMKMQIN